MRQWQRTLDTIVLCRILYSNSIASLYFLHSKNWDRFFVSSQLWNCCQELVEPSTNPTLFNTKHHCGAATFRILKSRLTFHLSMYNKYNTTSILPVVALSSSCLCYVNCMPRLKMTGFIKYCCIYLAKLEQCASLVNFLRIFYQN